MRGHISKRSSWQFVIDLGMHLRGTFIPIHAANRDKCTPQVGIHPKVVSERLGHANIGITLDCYSHCLPALSEEAACRVAALVVPD